MTLAPSFLVAAHPLRDPNFSRSVVLLAAHSEEGAFGWVVNGRTLMTIAELARRAGLPVDEGGDCGEVRFGGPVSPEQAWVIFRPTGDEEPEGTLLLASGVAATSSREMLAWAARGEGSLTRLFGVVGCAGWGPGQLEDEVAAGTWLPLPFEEELLFSVAPEKMWTEAYRRRGWNPLSFVSRTVGES